MEDERLACLGSHRLDMEQFLDGLEAVLKEGGFSLEWLSGADHAYASWQTYPEQGTWLFLTDSEMARAIAKGLAIHLRCPLHWFEAHCDIRGENAKLGYQAREVTEEGKVRLMPSDNLDGTDLNSITVGKVEDRLQQILDELTGCEDKPSRSHEFQLFRPPKTPEAPEVQVKLEVVDAKRVQEMIHAIDEGLVATLTREADDTYSLRVILESGTQHTSYAGPATVSALKRGLNERQRLKLLSPSVRPVSKKFRIPPRIYSSTEVEVRRLLADMLALDRFTIDIDRPLGLTGVTRDQFVTLMHLLSERYRIPIDETMINLIADSENWNSATQKMTVSDLAHFASDKFLNERQWDRS
ncbi:MAG TPA: hypothetical protein VG099_07630 [Gemmataceae bacterium]|jgi:hypothetical protein|nr:hypothetical protein [Gemmataceae bacterium]